MSDENMQKTPAPTEPIAEPDPATAQPVEPAAEPPTPETQTRPERQAARYRVELREAQAQRDAALAMLDQARRALIEKDNDIMSWVMSSARHDLTQAIPGEKLATFFDAQGQPDRDAIKEYVDSELERKPYLSCRNRLTDATKHIIRMHEGDGTFRLKRDPLKQALRK